MKIALITGASSGFGERFVANLAEYLKKGDDIDEIWAVARRLERLEKLQNFTEIKVRPVCGDITSNQFLSSLKELFVENKVQIKLLINCAGYGKIGEFDEILLEDNCGQIRLNCEALTAITQIALPYMDKNSDILNVASVAAFLPQPQFAVYAATKSYVLSFSKALRVELKKRNINVTTLCPGPAKTEFFNVAETIKKMPAFKRSFMYDADFVVKKGLKGLKKKRAVIVPGFCMKSFNILCKIIPHKILLAVFK